jgi:hypothetical protein
MQSPQRVETAVIMQNDRSRTEVQHQEQLEEEYLAAQRAAYESILIGRATAEVVQQQGEQLSRAESLVDDTQYKLDRATRLLKGMTWSGWVGNMFSSVPLPESSPSDGVSSSNTKAANGLTQHGLPSLDRHDNIPSSCHDVLQAVKNYLANVTVLRDCETKEQKETCVQICDTMYTEAMRQIEKLTSERKNQSMVEAYIIQLKDDLATIRKRQIDYQAQVCGILDSSLATTTPIRSIDNASLDRSTIKARKLDQETEELFGRQPSTSTTQLKVSISSSQKKSIKEQVQDEHLDVISASLGELGHIAQSLNNGFDQQQRTIESLETKSDNVYEISKMVARRTDRLIQKKSWTSTAKSVFYATVIIRHVETGKYLSVVGSDLYLVNRYSPISCTFDVHKRQGNVVGLKSRSNNKWMGQSFLTGSLLCAASTFGRREEWETDGSSNWTSPARTTDTMITRLLCTSAAWGQGGYIQVRVAESFAIQIGGMTADESKTAAQWSMTII